MASSPQRCVTGGERFPSQIFSPSGLTLTIYSWGQSTLSHVSTASGPPGLQLKFISIRSHLDTFKDFLLIPPCSVGFDVKWLRPLGSFQISKRKDFVLKGGLPGFEPRTFYTLSKTLIPDHQATQRSTS